MLYKSVLLLFLVASLCVITFFKDRIKSKAFVFSLVSVLYILVLASFTVISRESVSEIALIPFRTFFEILSVRWYGWGEYIFLAIVGNMLLFVPFGMVFGNVVECKHKGLMCLATGFVVSLSIECIQLMFSIGAFEVDDMIINTWGAVIGCAVVDTIIKRDKSIIANLRSLIPLVAFCIVVFAFCIYPFFKEIIQLF